jgi:hypothetical protein
MEFKKISATEILTEVPENATVLGIVNGAVKQMPTYGMGGDKALIVKIDGFDDAGSGAAPMSVEEFSATANMTFDEALVAFRACEIQSVAMYLSLNGYPTFLTCMMRDVMQTMDVECLEISVSGGLSLFWTADGISNEEPSSGGPL